VRQRLVHRADDETNGVGSHPLLAHQVRVQLWVGPPLVVGLPLRAEGAQLDDRRAGPGQCQQHLFARGAVGRHLGLSREEQVGPWRRDLGTVRPTAKVRQRGEPEGGLHRQLTSQLGELGDLAVTVQHQQVAAGPQGEASGRGRDADSRQAGDQHGTVGCAKGRRRCQGGDDRAGCGEQHDIWRLSA
jgi:hypothetical protein